VAAVVVAAVAAAGLAAGIVGRTARVVTAVGSLALVGVAARVGHTGGQLVYRYGAASAYTTGAGSSQAASTRTAEPSHD
jgi:hypothetical protein